MENNFEILGLAEGASKREIQEAFRKLALKHHSDRGGDEEKFKKIKQAYEDLKIGKTHPDTDKERLRKSQVYTGDDEEEIRRRNKIIAGELYEEMKVAEEWAAALNRSKATATRLFGSKTVGQIELEVKANGMLSIKGNFLAGSIIYDGPVLMQGNITSPSFSDEYVTNITLTKGDFRLVDPTENKYKIDNGSQITAEAGNIIVGNVFGKKDQVQDPTGKVGVYITREHRTKLSAPRGRIVAENVVNTVELEADAVTTLNLEDDVMVRAREILIYGHKITYDVQIHLLEGGFIRFFEKFSVQGLSDDARIILADGRAVSLHDIKTKKIHSLPDELVGDKTGYGKNDTMVGNGFTITYQMLDMLTGKRQEKRGGWRSKLGIR